MGPSGDARIKPRKKPVNIALSIQSLNLFSGGTIFTPPSMAEKKRRSVSDNPISDGH